MPESAPPPKIDVLFAGQPWDVGMKADFLQVTVTDRLDAADCCVLRFNNPEMRYHGHDSFKPGTAVEVKLGWGDETQTVFWGDVVGTEMVFPREGPPKIDVRSFDPLFRLMRKKQERTFLDIKDSDVAAQVAQEHGLQTDVDTTDVTHPYLMQSGESDWDFLVTRARCAGRVVRVDDGTLTFKATDARPDAVRELTLEADLPAFKMQTSVESLPSAVLVKSWDAQAKAKIEATARDSDIAAELGTSELGITLGQQALGDATEQVSEIPVQSTQEAVILAKSLLLEASRQFASAAFTVQGDPLLRAGHVVTLTGMGERLSGDYRIVTSHHLFTTDGYNTKVELTRNGWVPPPPSESEGEEAEAETVDIEAILVDALGEPLPDTPYKIFLADGKIREGTTDGDGKLLESGCPKGPYKIETEEFTLSVLERN